METTLTLPASRTLDGTFPEDILFDTDYPIVTEGFIVDSLEKATWATNRYLSAGKRIRERQDLAEAYKKRIDLWFDRANKSDRDTQDFMTYLLTPYVREYLDKQKRGKSFRVLGARLGFRKASGHLDILDEDAAIAYCKEHLPDVLAVKTDIAKAIAKSYIADGFNIPGIEIAEGSEELVIKETDDEQA